MAWRPDYATAAELASYLRIGDDVDDVELALAVTDASRAIDRATNRQFGLVDAPEARKYTAHWDRILGAYVLEIDDLMTQAGLTIVTQAGLELTEYTLEPVNAAADGEPWTSLVFDAAPYPACVRNGNTVTASWGWTEVPDPIKQACLLQGARFFTRRNAPFGVAGSPELGSEVRLQAKVDPDVAVSIGPYTRWWAAA